MKDWSEYTEEDCEALYNGSFNLDAVLNSTTPAQGTHAAPSMETGPVKDLRGQLEEVQLRENKLQQKEKEFLALTVELEETKRN